ncbi:MAG: hypothetical protein NVSMB46_07080 [Candidatus Saccharimonadales bacterium]
MALDNYDTQKLQELEESLWKRETRFNETYMKSILAEDFFEFGRSGKVYSREESLSVSDQEIHAKLPLKDFAIHEIDENVVLITYISEVQYDEMEIGNRSSLWIKSDSEWKLKFHQGTPTKLN